MRTTWLFVLVAFSIAIVSSKFADEYEDPELSPDVHGSKGSLIDFFNEDVERSPRSAGGNDDNNSGNSKPQRPNKRPNKKKPNKKKPNKKKPNKKPNRS
ncbi:unnamed protein product [Hermetia illucens]|uniref:Uncharacterized protein n=1 Tax=Hermetia illucens TaxID=343691 RepID=A0A7R8UZ72_HERIL|nr:unnamed protein product [Hermetia illucens]